MNVPVFKYIAVGCCLYILWIVAQVILVASGPFAPLLIFGLPIVYLVIYLLVKLVIVVFRCLFKWFIRV